MFIEDNMGDVGCALVHLNTCITLSPLVAGEKLLKATSLDCVRDATLTPTMANMAKMSYMV